MTDQPNFVLVPDPDPNGEPRPRPAPSLLAHARTLAQWLLPGRFALPAPDAPAWSGRARLVFGFDATASREPAWDTARQVTDALVRALPGELDVALAVHGGARLHTFTDFTADPNT